MPRVIKGKTIRNQSDKISDAYWMVSTVLLLPLLMAGTGILTVRAEPAFTGNEDSVVDASQNGSSQVAKLLSLFWTSGGVIQFQFWCFQLSQHIESTLDFCSGKDVLIRSE